MRIRGSAWMGGIIVFCCHCIGYPADALHTEPPSPQPVTAADPDRNGYPEPELLERQHAWTLYWADRLLRANPPGEGDPGVRRMALAGIDEVMHHPAVPGNSPAAEAFALQRFAVAAHEIEHGTPVVGGARIWKLYNHGFIVRTETVTLAFDLVRGWWAWNGSTGFDDPVQRITARCDVLFISHEHGDHAEQWVALEFLNQGKPVVAPDGVFAGDARILRPERGLEARKEIRLSGDRSLQVSVYPGYQGDVLNNVYIVHTPDGLSFGHTGDLFQRNSTPGDMFEWIDGVSSRDRVDVLMVNSWIMKLSRVVRGFNPRLVVTGHENELGHDIERRKPYFLSFDRLAGIDQPGVVMTWGESVLYHR